MIRVPLLGISQLDGIGVALVVVGDHPDFGVFKVVHRVLHLPIQKSELLVGWEILQLDPNGRRDEDRRRQLGGQFTEGLGGILDVDVFVIAEIEEVDVDIGVDDADNPAAVPVVWKVEVKVELENEKEPRMGPRTKKPYHQTCTGRHHPLRACPPQPRASFSARTEFVP